MLGTLEDGVVDVVDVSVGVKFDDKGGVGASTDLDIDGRVVRCGFCSFEARE